MSLKLEFIISMIDRATKPVADISRGIDRMTKPAREVRAQLNALMGAARFDNLRRSVAQVGTAFDGLMSSVRGVAALVGSVGFAAGAAFYGFKRVADGVDGINDLAIKVGITTQRLQEMGFAAQAAGSNQEDLGQSLMFLNKNIAEARAGSAEMIAAFADVGITQKDLRNSAFTAADAYERMGDVFMRAAATGRDGAAMTRVSMTLMGRAGAQQIQALSQGSAKMREMYAEARRLGVVLSGDTVKAMVDFNDQFDIAKLTLFGAMATALGGIAPRIQAVVERFTKWISTNRELIGTRIVEMFERIEQVLPKVLRVVEELSGALGVLLRIADAVAQAVGGWGNVLYAVAGIVSLKVVVAVYELAKALGFLSVASGALAVTPLGLFVMGVAAVAAIGVEIYRNWEPIKQLFADMFPNITKLVEMLPSVGAKVSSAIDWLFPGTMEGQQVHAAPGAPANGTSAIAPGAPGAKAEVGGTLNITVDDQRTRVTKAEKAPGGKLELSVYSGPNYGGAW